MLLEHERVKCGKTWDGNPRPSKKNIHRPNFREVVGAAKLVACCHIVGKEHAQMT